MGTILYLSIERHPEQLRVTIRKKLSDAGFVCVESSYEELLEKGHDFLPWHDFDGLLLAPARSLPFEVYSKLVKCKLIQIWSSGFDKFNLADAHSQGMLVANNNGANAQAVAEHTILLVLSISRKLTRMVEYVNNNDWSGNGHGVDLNSVWGKTLGLIGLGRIGTRVATIAKSLGMKVIYFDPHIKGSNGCESVSLEQLLGKSDYISLHTHLNKDTKGMINRSNIGFIAKQPYIVNVSRAELIEKEALRTMIETNMISGLALDVFYTEPNAKSEDWIKKINFVGTPHIAGSTIETYEAAVNFCIKNLQNAIWEKDGIQGILR